MGSRRVSEDFGEVVACSGVEMVCDPVPPVVEVHLVQLVRQAVLGGETELRACGEVECIVCSLCRLPVSNDLSFQNWINWVQHPLPVSSTLNLWPPRSSFQMPIRVCLTVTVIFNVWRRAEVVELSESAHKGGMREVIGQRTRWLELPCVRQTALIFTPHVQSYSAPKKKTLLLLLLLVDLFSGNQWLVQSTVVDQSMRSFDCRVCSCWIGAIDTSSSRRSVPVCTTRGFDTEGDCR